MNTTKLGRNVSQYNGTAARALAYEAIGRHVQATIESRGITQAEVCRRCSLSVSALQALLRGTQIPVLVLVRVATALGVTVDELIPTEVRT